MALFDFSDGSLSEVPPTSFIAEGVLERTHLQRALREHIGVLGDDLMVVSEEFGGFDGARRRIDLLCVDPQGRLVVVELKRTEDGGHMELQALRYAAMVSAMTVDRLVDIYEAHLTALEPDAVDEARTRLLDWFDDGEEAVLSREVRVVLVSADFGREITTTVLWLNDVYAMDIRCVRLTPYRVDGKLLLDVQPLIPLPEAEEMTVQLRQQATAARAAVASGRDWTPYVIVGPGGVRTEPLRKRHAVRTMLHAVHDAGVPARTLATVFPRAKFLPVDGVLTGDELRAAFVAAHPNARNRLGRWFLDDPVHEADRTWVLSKQWGATTVATLDALAALAPDQNLRYEPA
jgi:hypothetical protein